MTSEGKTRAGARAFPRLMAWLRPERPRLILVVALGVISVVLSVAGPKLLGNATNVLFAGLVGQHMRAGQTKAEVIAQLRAHGQGQLADMFSAVNFVPGTGVDITRLGQLLGVAALVYLVATVFGGIQGYIMSGIVARAIYRLRQAVEEKLARLPLQYFDRHSHGDILSLVTNDIDNIYTTLQEGLSQLLTSALTVIGTLGMMFWISPLLAVASLVTIPLAIVTTSALARRSKTRFDEVWDRVGKLNGMIEENHAGHALVAVFGQRQQAFEEFDQQNTALFRASLPAQFLSGVVLPVVQFVGNLNFVIIAALGGYQVATGAISFGAAQAFIQYSRRFTIPLNQIAGQLNLIQSGRASMQRVFDFLDVPEEEAIADRSGPVEAKSPDAPAAAARRVQLRQVSFRYDPQRPLIEDFSLEAAPGQTVAIVGPTGAGKTTIVNLLMRFYEIDSGQILLDGADYRDLGRDQVRRCFGIVLQETWLFGGTIRDNIGYGKEGAAEAEILAAARAAYVDDFVRTLPDGYATVLDDEASSISAGQKQLLTIARAFLADPGILILDEATSNVDTRTEVLIQEAMGRLRAGRTSFVIAHRLSTIRAADTIVVMDAGRVVEQGCHQELLARHGFYRDLYDSQFAEVVAP